MPQVREGADGEFAPPLTASVLSFHGGGFLGYFSALVARTLTERKAALGASAPLAASFDIVAGTSVGAILAAAVACEIDPGKVADLMARHGRGLFPRRWLFPTMPGVLGARFSPEPLRKLLDQVLGARTLGSLDRALLIPAINETTGRPAVFRSHDPRQARFRLADIVMASAAAPSYFPLHRIGRERYADGGLIANGPELLACADLAARFDVPIGSIQLLSIGTTSAPLRSRVPLDRRRDRGLWAWLLRHERLQPLLLGTQIDLQAEIVAAFRPRAYIHLDMELSDTEAARVHMVRADPAAQRTLEDAAARLARRIAQDDRAEIDRILSRTARHTCFRSEAGSSRLTPRLVRVTREQL